MISMNTTSNNADRENLMTAVLPFLVIIVLKTYGRKP